MPAVEGRDGTDPNREARSTASCMATGATTMPWPRSPSMRQVALLSRTIFQSGEGFVAPESSSPM